MHACAWQVKRDANTTAAAEEVQAAISNCLLIALQKNSPAFVKLFLEHGAQLHKVCTTDGCLCACVCVCVRACLRVCARVCVYVCACLHVSYLIICTSSPSPAAIPQHPWRKQISEVEQLED